MNNAQEVLATSTQNLLALVETLSEAQVNFKVADSQWSILECLEHIFISEAGVIKLFRIPKQADNAPGSKVAHEFIHKLMQNRDKKYPAPDIVNPTGRFKSLGEFLNAFKTKRAELATLIAQTDWQDGISAPHPRLGELTKADWLQFTIEHTARHLEQIAEIKQDEHFPAS